MLMCAADRPRNRRPPVCIDVPSYRTVYGSSVGSRGSCALGTHGCDPVYHRGTAAALVYSLVPKAGSTTVSCTGRPAGTPQSSAVHCCRPPRAQPRALQSGNGSIVNVTSIAGERVHPFAGSPLPAESCGSLLSLLRLRMRFSRGIGHVWIGAAPHLRRDFCARAAGSAYATSKAALACLTREMASNFGAHGVRVNAISPGATPPSRSAAAMQPARRFSRPVATPCATAAAPTCTRAAPT